MAARREIRACAKYNEDALEGGEFSSAAPELECDERCRSDADSLSEFTEAEASAAAESCDFLAEGLTIAAGAGSEMACGEFEAESAKSGLPRGDVAAGLLKEPNSSLRQAGLLCKFCLSQAGAFSLRAEQIAESENRRILVQMGSLRGQKP